jgi:hypothetical protein
MTLIQTLLRRLPSQSAEVAVKSPVPLQPELLKSVSGGNGGGTQSPRNGW